MSSPFQGLDEVFARHAENVDAAVERARRAAAEAREESARFSHETAELTEQVRDREVRPEPEDLTSDELRRDATRFRTERGLPVVDLPDGAELLSAPEKDEPDEPRPEPPPEYVIEGIEPEELLAEEAEERAAASLAPPTPVRRRRRAAPPPDDEDDDFSQERIMDNG
ncbi:hypothetical protein EV193_106369 [Herbihabitans rhizosphaerae]|uniref:Uncharacterized protein n=1 Tax=Herbihabitans rhizosphaerae TaxID=1872711 RepID=A0A4Q7KNB9_9PSEU|nr:hypothetical protein [Herbihabitans rhizosphaerae]RZS37131.1 hypothetical protein EV193_106369 [Herbihabitans rhizosphaerae]